MNGENTTGQAAPQLKSSSSDTSGELEEELEKSQLAPSPPVAPRGLAEAGLKYSLLKKLSLAMCAGAMFFLLVLYGIVPCFLWAQREVTYAGITARSQSAKRDWYPIWCELMDKANDAQSIASSWMIIDENSVFVRYFSQDAEFYRLKALTLLNNIRPQSPYVKYVKGQTCCEPGDEEFQLKQMIRNFTEGAGPRDLSLRGAWKALGTFYWLQKRWKEAADAHKRALAVQWTNNSAFESDGMPLSGMTTEDLARFVQESLAELGEEVSGYSMPPRIPLDTLRKRKPVDVEVFGLLSDCGPGFWHPEPQKIEQKLKKVFTLAEKTYGNQDRHTAHVMNSYACWLKTQGRYKEAKDFDQRVDKIMEKYPPPPHLDRDWIHLLDPPPWFTPESSP